MPFPQNTTQAIEMAISHIARGQTEKALALLLNVEDEKYRSHFISFSNRLERLKQDKIKGVIDAGTYELRYNQITDGLLKALHAWKDKPQQGPGRGIKRWVFFGFGGLAILSLSIWLLIRPGVDCGPEGKTVIHVADFTAGGDAFSKVLRGEITNKIGNTHYAVLPATYFEAENTQALASYQTKAFQDCSRSGLMVYGDLIIQAGIDPVLACYIQLINMNFRLPDLITGQETYFIKNPPGLEFKIGTHAELITGFIRALLNVYTAKDIAELDSALEQLNQLKASKLSQEDEMVLAAATYYEAVALTMKGNVEAARGAFQQISTVPKYKEVVKNNLKYLEKLEIQQIKDPQFVPFLQTGAAIPISGLPKDTSEVTEVDQINSEEVDSADLEAANDLQEEQKTKSADTKNNLLVIDKNGNQYATKTMKDGKRWMTQNLNLEVKDSWCYDNNTSNCTKYGRLYTWEAAKKACATLGDGWHLPTDEEWTTMVDQYGGANRGNATDDGKAAYQILSENGSAGFAALLGGLRSSDGSFLGLGVGGYYWSATERDGGNAVDYYFNGVAEGLDRDDDDQSLGLSVRCLQN